MPCDQIWYNWQTSAITATTTEYVWATWNNTTSTGTYVFNDQPRDHFVQETEDQRREREQNARRLEEGRKKRIEQIRLAEERANELLHSLLDDQQWEDWMSKHCFKVIGSEGGLYLINKGYAGNVKRIDQQERMIESLCIHPKMQTDQGRLPEADVVIAQLLTIKTDESEFRKVANIKSTVAA